jgi:hypothetical protein
MSTGAKRSCLTKKNIGKQKSADTVPLRLCWILPQPALLESVYTEYCTLSKITWRLYELTISFYISAKKLSLYYALDLTGGLGGGEGGGGQGVVFPFFTAFP